MQAVARREIAASAKHLARTSDDLHGNAKKIVTADGAGSKPVHDLARHADAVASALRAHARAFDPDITQLPPAAESAAKGRARDEELVLAALLQHHPQTEEILDRPLFHGFTGPDRPALYRTIRDLHASGRDVDALTVDWEVARRASRQDPDPRREGTPARSTAPSLAERLAALDTGPANILSVTGLLQIRPASALPKLPPPEPAQERPPLLPPPDLPGPAPGPVHR